MKLLKQLLRWTIRLLIKTNLEPTFFACCYTEVTGFFYIIFLPMQPLAHNMHLNNETDQK